MASPSFTIGSMSAVTSISAVTMIAPVQRFKMLNFSSMVYLLSMVGSVGEHRSIHAGCVIGPESRALSGLVALLCGHGDDDGVGVKKGADHVRPSALAMAARIMRHLPSSGHHGGPRRAVGERPECRRMRARPSQFSGRRCPPAHPKASPGTPCTAGTFCL